MSVIQGEGRSEPVDGNSLIFGGRPALTSIELHQVGNAVEATVTLALAGRVLTGSSAGDAEQATTIIADATVAAVSSMIDGLVTVEAATIIELRGRRIAMSVVHVDSSEPHEILVGSALVRGDVEDAVARCVLSALNRRLTR